MCKKALIVYFLSVCALSGCAIKNDKTSVQGLGLTYQSEVKKLPDGNFYTEVEAALDSGRQSGAHSQVIKNAVDFCREKNKTMKEIKTETDSHLIINGVARLIFQCV